MLLALAQFRCAFLDPHVQSIAGFPQGLLRPLAVGDVIIDLQHHRMDRAVAQDPGTGDMDYASIGAVLGLLPLPPPRFVQCRPDCLQGLREFGLEQFMTDATDRLLGREAIEPSTTLAPKHNTILDIADQELAQVGQLRQVRQFVHLPALADSVPAHLLAHGADDQSAGQEDPQPGH